MQQDENSILQFVTSIPELQATATEIAAYLQDQHQFASMQAFVQQHPNEFFAFSLPQTTLYTIEKHLMNMPSNNKKFTMNKSISLQSMISITSQESGHLSLPDAEFITMNAAEFALTHIFDPALLGKECILRLCDDGTSCNELWCSTANAQENNSNNEDLAPYTCLVKKKHKPSDETHLEQQEQAKMHFLHACTVLQTHAQKYVCKWYGMVETVDHYLIAMEQPSLTLYDVLHSDAQNDAIDVRASWDMQKRIQYMIRAVECLQCVHNLNVAHRNIKSQNFYLDDSKQLLLGEIDAPSSSLHAASKHSKGSLYWIAPEQLKKSYANTDEQAKLCDIFSLGIVLCEIFWNQRPFAHIENIRMRGSCNMPFQKLPYSDKSLYILLQSMMHLDPAKRPTLAAVLSKLQTFLSQTCLQKELTSRLPTFFDKLVPNTKSIQQARWMVMNDASCIGTLPMDVQCNKEILQIACKLHFKTLWNYIQTCYDQKKYANIIPLLIEMARNKYVEAQMLLGQMYEHGFGVDKDEIVASTWYRQAAQLGDAAGLCSMGYCYEHGIGVDKDIPTAVEMYRKAAEHGFTRAQNNLALCYYNGVGVAKDDAQALVWFKKAAAKENITAMFNVAYLLEHSTNAAQRDDAMFWYQKCALHGHSAAKKAVHRLSQ